VLLLVRHASAGDRDLWEGDDHERPLDDRGRRQAEALVDQLARFTVERVLTSPALRCVRTVEPLAAARGLELEVLDELTEHRHWDDGAEIVRGLAGTPIAVCGHGGLHDVVPDAPKWKKSATFVLDDELRLVEVLPPPA
jgi:phosphohistidine phosphatase SixA